LAMAQGDMANAHLPKMPGDGLRRPLQLQASAIPEHANENNRLTNSEREMDAEMMQVKSTKPSAEELDATISDAKDRARTNVAIAVPGLDAVLTHAHSLPETNIPTIPIGGTIDEPSEVVPWEKWHERFANLASDPILKNVSGSKVRSGFVTVQVTVWRDHRVEAKLTKSTNTDFDRAILAAYKSLNGNPGLAFPEHSRRDNITFLVDNEHKAPTTPSTVQSKTSVGDKEVIRYHI
jgi:hypothetical protein